MLLKRDLKSIYFPKCRNGLPVFILGILLLYPQICFASTHKVTLPENFYENPNKDAVIDLFGEMATRPDLGTSSKTGYRISTYRIMGFIARVAQDHPSWIEDWVPLFSKLDEPKRFLVAMAIASGNSDESEKALSQWAKTGHSKIVALIRSWDLKTLLKFDVISLDILSTFEGAYRASGDTYYLAQILKGFAMSLPFGPGPKTPNAVLSHLIPATVFALYNSDQQARLWFDEQIATNTHGVGEILGRMVRHFSTGQPK